MTGAATVGRRPVLTLTALAVAVVAAIAQYTVPPMIPALQRDSGGLVDGQWWRLVTPLLVQTLGWYQVLANLASLAIIGLVSERLLGRRRWLIAFVSGTFGGQLVAYAWQEPGGGASIAICGLAGGSVVALLAAPAPRWAVSIVGYIAALTGWGFGGVPAAGLACLVAGFLPYPFRHVRLDVERLSLIGTVLCAMALAAARDLHGASLAAGMAAMAVTCERSTTKIHLSGGREGRNRARPPDALGLNPSPGTRRVPRPPERPPKRPAPDAAPAPGLPPPT